MLLTTLSTQLSPFLQEHLGCSAPVQRCPASFLDVLCFRSGPCCLPHYHTDRHPARADPKQLSSPQSKRPRPTPAAFSCSGPEFHLAANVPVNSCTVPRRHGSIHHPPEDILYGGIGPDLPCYPPPSHGRGLTSMTEELGGSEPPIGGSASLLSLKHCGLEFPLRPLCGPPTCRVAARCTFQRCPTGDPQVA